MEYGYTGKAAVIELSSGKVTNLEISEELKREYLGGRGFIAKWLFDWVAPETDPLGEENILIFATGPLTGTLAPTGARIAIGAKAPETGIWSIGNAGGNFGAQLKRAGFDALILKGKSPERIYIHITDGKIIIKPADYLWGTDTVQIDSAIKKELRDWELSIACIGPAGENLAPVATVIVDRVRSGGRGGLGAVMGSKNLKAIAVHGHSNINIYNPKAFYQECVKTQDISVKLYFKKRWTVGSYGAIRRYNSVGCMSTRNAQTTQFEDIEGITAEKYLEKYKLPSMRACFACPIACWTYFYIPEGKFAGFYDSNVNATTLKECGARVGLGKMDAVLYTSTLCNHLGLDTISAPSIIAFAMECYQRGVITTADTEGLVLNWGDEDVMINLFEKMASMKGFGAQLSMGIRYCAKLWGKGCEHYALHVKGMETTATDPRGQPSWGLGYATSSRGACHMRAYGNYEYGGMSKEEMLRIAGTEKIAIRFSYEGKGKANAYLENLRAIGDAIGLCHLHTRAKLGFQEALTPLIYSSTGLEFTPEELFRLGERIYNLERLANLRFGLTPADDTLPARYLEDPVPDGPAKDKVIPLEKMLKEYYLARDWNWETGYPSEKKMIELGMGDMIE